MVGIVIVDGLLLMPWTRCCWLMITAYVRLRWCRIIRTRGIGALLRLIYHSRFHNSHLHLHSLLLWDLSLSFTHSDYYKLLLFANHGTTQPHECAIFTPLIRSLCYTHLAPHGRRRRLIFTVSPLVATKEIA